MLEFCKNELKKQNNLTFTLINVPYDNNSRQLSQLIINQKLLLESLIWEIENPSYAPYFTDVQTKIGSYYNNYFQQQKLLVTMGLGDYLLPNLNPMQSELRNTKAEEPRFFDRTYFAPSAYHNPQLESAANNSPASDSAPSCKSINKLTVSNSPSFFSSKAEQPLSTETKPAKERAPLQKNMGQSIGVEKKQLNTLKKQEKSTSRENETKEKKRTASRDFRKRQIEYTQSLENKLDGLQNEEQEIINQINNLKLENMELRKRQQLLRGIITYALTNNTLSTNIEEPSLNTQYNI